MSNKNVVRKLEKSLEKKLKQSQEIYNDKRWLNALADASAKQIKKRTQLGKGVTGSGSTQKLKGLTSKYKEERKKFKSGLDSNTTPNKSNLTATGQLLNALRGVYKRKSIILDFNPERRGPDFRGYRGKAKNSDIVGYQKGQGRRFFDLSNTELNGIRRQIANRIRKLLAK